MNRDGSKGAGVLMDRRRRSGDDSPREGLYSSHLAAWRRARRAGSMEHTASGFRAGYGYGKGAQLISRDGHSLFTNSLIPLRAVLGGTAVGVCRRPDPHLVVVHLGRGEAVVVMSPV